MSIGISARAIAFACMVGEEEDSGLRRRLGAIIVFMKVLLLLILAFITSSLFKTSPGKNVLSAQATVEPTLTIQPSVTTTPTVTIKPTAKPTTTGNTSVSINSNVHIVNNGTGGENGKVKIIVQGSDWQYPGSADDSAATVTDWFVNKIKSQGMSTTSFVKTNANDHVLNCLAAGAQVKIEISQNSDANCQW